jgi:enoyl-CoA hydratase
MDYRNIIVAQDGPVTTITFNRPDILNPIDIDTLLEMNSAFDAIAEGNGTEIVLIRGTGRAFSAGGDLKAHMRIHQDVHIMRRMNNIATAVSRRIEDLEQIVIAVVEGLCVAGGVEMALCCDYIIATDEAKFSDGHMNISLLPGAGGTQRMPRLIGALKAKDLMLTARFISGQEAADMGLATFCYPKAELETKLTELIATLSSKSFAARAAIKYLVNQGLKGTLESGLHLEKSYVEHFETTHPDAHEGLLAFAEKRKPVFGKQ